MRRIRRKNAITWAIFACWAAVITVPMSYLMAGHFASYEAPKEIILTASHQITSDSWSLVHVLSAECKCSMGVAEYLISRRAIESAVETIVLLDGDEKLRSSLTGAGYDVSMVDSEHLCEDYGSMAVPYFQVVTDTRELYFSGGYLKTSDRTQFDFSDVLALEKAKNGESLEERTFFGCATSAALKTKLNPFNF